MLFECILPEQCDWCPRVCGAHRAIGQRGVCGADDTLRVARAALHFWEEPVISGEAGSGTIFFSHCPLHCVYCQNSRIAQGATGKDVSIERLARIMIELQEQNALNINMVTPTHYTYHIIEAVRLAREQGMTLPIVWNTSGYERVEVIQDLADTVDVYLADFKYASSETAMQYSHVADYPEVATAAIEAMLAQVGEPQYDEVDGQQRMRRGVIVRHLLLPGHVDESYDAIDMLYARFGNALRYSLMNQYTPVIDSASSVAARFPRLLERVNEDEYAAFLDYADAKGIDDYFWQEGPAAEESFIPAFDNTGV